MLYELVQVDELPEILQLLSHPWELAFDARLEVLETCLQLLLYKNEIEIASGFQKVEERVHGDVLNDHPAIEPRAYELLHSIIRLLYLFRELVPAAPEHRKVHILSGIKLCLQQLHEFIFERYLERVEVLEVDEVGLKFFDVGSNAAEKAYPN